MSPSNKVDLIYLTCNRLEFTRFTFRAMLHNTAWQFVRRFIWYDAQSVDGTAQFFCSVADQIPVDTSFRIGNYSGPAEAIKDYLADDPAEIYCRVDNDTVVPAHWLQESLAVMERYPELGTLGIEVEDVIVAGKCRRGYTPCTSVRGVRLARANPGPRICGWLSPALPVVLLDMVPTQPWMALSERYVAEGWQHPKIGYNRKRGYLWNWRFVQEELDGLEDWHQ